ncbi:MAG: Asp-tRNA(Asn)/Glu-tRNA(Gln) amidotransferase subunit GatC [Patescibacteria group bacterium]|nr:aspartyl/glutamyl-tRNA amidotransferase subunit C [Patescibacteria group bacterium]
MKKKKSSFFDIPALSALAKLRVSGKKLKEYQNQLGEVLNFIKQLEKVDVSSVESTSRTIEINNVFFEDGITPDQVLKSLKNLKIRKVANQGNYFVTKRVKWQS